jgi:hypothetical protein
MRNCLTLTFFVALLYTSCDPIVTVNYKITNSTDEELEVKIFGLHDQYQGLLQQYDTVIGQGAKISIYGYSEISSDYINPTDTITIFDSIQVVKNSINAKSDFKKLETWDYSEERYKYGGGNYFYELNIKNDDF